MRVVCRFSLVISSTLDAIILNHLSAPRVNTYRTFFKTRNSSELSGAYAWNSAIGSTLWLLVSLAEITLRNSTHLSLSQFYGGSDSYAWYDNTMPKHMPLKALPFHQANELLQTAINQNPDEFVSQTSFGFWVEALRQIEKGQKYKRASEIMPFNPYRSDKSAWKFPEATWITCLRPFAEVKEFRDRIGHHKPLFRWRYKESGTIHTPVNASQALKSLIQFEKQTVEALTWIDPNLKRAWRSSFGFQWFSRLCSTDALNGFIHNGTAVAMQHPHRVAYQQAKNFFT